MNRPAIVRAPNAGRQNSSEAMAKNPVASQVCSVPWQNRSSGLQNDSGKRQTLTARARIRKNRSPERRIMPRGAESMLLTFLAPQRRKNLGTAVRAAPNGDSPASQYSWNLDIRSHSVLQPIPEGFELGMVPDLIKVRILVQVALGCFGVDFLPPLQGVNGFVGLALKGSKASYVK